MKRGGSDIVFQPIDTFHDYSTKVSAEQLLRPHRILTSHNIVRVLVCKRPIRDDHRMSAAKHDKARVAGRLVFNI